MMAKGKMQEFKTGEKWPEWTKFVVCTGAGTYMMFSEESDYKEWYKEFLEKEKAWLEDFRNRMKAEEEIDSRAGRIGFCA